MNPPINTPTEIIETFLKLLQEKNKVFSLEITTNLTSLRNSIKSLSNPNDDDLATTILDWIQPYRSLKKAMLGELQRVISREEQKINVDIDQRNQSEKVDNKTLLSETIEDFQKKYLGKSQ